MKNTVKYLSILALIMLNKESAYSQLKVTSTGNVGVRTLTPLAEFHVIGNSVFTSGTTVPVSSAFLRGNTIYSGQSSPDYTWYGDDKTGIYHPFDNCIAFSIEGKPKMQIVNNAVYFKFDDISPLLSSPLIRQTNDFSLPSNTDYSWFNDLGTGIFHPSQSTLGISVNGQTAMKVVTGAVYFPGGNGVPTSSPFIRTTSANSTAALPDYTWFYDDNTGLFHPVGGGIGFSVVGTERMKINNSGQVSIAGSPYGTAKLSVNGIAWCSGGIWTPSDLKFKRNIKPIDGALNKILKINGKSYEYKQDEFKDINFNSGKTYGFIAQEIAKVLPEITQVDTLGFYSICYEQVIPILVEALKEQNQEIELLKEKTQNCYALQNKYNISEKLLENSQVNNEKDSYLLQNKPNPFDQNTTIGFVLPFNAKNASIIIFNLNGKSLKSYDISKIKEGELNISGKEFEPGMYLYTLIVDGKELDTKRMILTE